MMGRQRLEDAQTFAQNMVGGLFLKSKKIVFFMGLMTHCVKIGKQEFLSIKKLEKHMQ